jgi:hypothetical protein
MRREYVSLYHVTLGTAWIASTSDYAPLVNGG